MKEQNKLLAKDLLEHHPGMPNEDVALEFVGTVMDVMRKFILREKKLKLEGIGTLEIKDFAGAEKRDARYDVKYAVSARKVVKFKVADNLKKLINIERKPSKRIE